MECIKSCLLFKNCGNPEAGDHLRPSQITSAALLHHRSSSWKLWSALTTTQHTDDTHWGGFHFKSHGVGRGWRTRMLAANAGPASRWLISQDFPQSILGWLFKVSFDPDLRFHAAAGHGQL